MKFSETLIQKTLEEMRIEAERQGEAIYYTAAKLVLEARAKVVELEHECDSMREALHAQDVQLAEYQARHVDIMNRIRQACVKMDERRQARCECGAMPWPGSVDKCISCDPQLKSRAN